MTAVVHTTIIADTWSGTIPAATVGNTLFIVASGYSSSAGWIHTMQPSYNGVVGGQLVAEGMSNITGSEVYIAIWMIPNVQSSGTAVGITMTGQVTSPTAGAVGLIVYEVSGLGATPVVNRAVTAAGSAGNPTVSTGWTASADTFVLAGTIGWALNQNGAGAPWTEVHWSNTWGFSGYQIIPTGSTPNLTYDSVLTAGGANWVAAICSVGASADPSPKLENWLAGYDIQPSVGTTPGDLDVFASMAFNFLAAPPMCRAVQTVTEAIAASGSFIPITFDTVLEARMCSLNGSTFTAQVDGWYNITATIQGPAVVGIVGLPGLSYVINGTANGPWVYSLSAVGNSGGWSWQATQDIYLNAGDTATVNMAQLTPGSAFNTSVSTAPPYASSSTVEIVWISE